MMPASSIASGRVHQARASALVAADGGTWLADGTPVQIRPIQPDDLELERRFFAGLSRETRYRRLMSGRELTPNELERWTRIDPTREITLVAVATLAGIAVELGLAQCVRDAAEPRLCDFALVIGDDWQHQGLGREMLSTLMRSAAAAGIGVMSGITLSDNRGMMALARELGFTVRRVAGDATTMQVERQLDMSAQHVA